MKKQENTDNPRLRVALCIWMFKPGTGGLQSHAEQLARYLTIQGHSVTVITRAFTRVPEGLEFLTWSELVSEGLVNGIPVQAVGAPIPSPRFARLVAGLCKRAKLWPVGVALFRRFSRKSWRDLQGFDLVHHVGQADQLFGFFTADAARFHGVPFVAQPTCHPFVVGDQPMDLALYGKADRAFVHTLYESEHLSPKVPGVPFDIVGNGIEDRSDGREESFRKEIDVDGPLILYLGRRDVDKGYPIMIEAYQQLRKERPEVTLVCMGPSGGLPKVEGEGIIHFEFADEQTKHNALAACTCLCVPSQGESFGLVYMEAGRYGKPVIARRLPVLEELLADGEAGMLVGELDRSCNWNDLSAEALKDAIVKMIDDPALRNKLGEECLKASETFVWPKVVKRFVESWRKTLE